MNVLVLAQAYPNLDGDKTLMYIHVRNKYYVQHGIDVTVVNFSTNKNYIIDGVQVITEQDYLSIQDNFNLLVSHAPNIRNHYRFIKKYESNFKHIIFFFHGHEVLKINQEYPKDYFYVKATSLSRRILRNIYDDYKLLKWRNYFLKLREKSEFIFVSEWMQKKFFEYTKLNPSLLMEHCHIIYNSVGTIFESQKYYPVLPYKYDFITVRGNLDGAKYCIDIVNFLAETHPKFQFLIIGKGEYFKYNHMASNIQLINKQISHEEMLDLLNQAKYALMPTRLDAQGVMACEFATFGIPLITSDIFVCTEIFSGCSKVAFIDNENPDLEQAIEKLQNADSSEWTRFYAENTILKEITLLKNIL